jgi:hypothetical protein
MKGLSMLLIAVVMGLGSYLAIDAFVLASEETAAAPVRFPIISRVELPREFGYFIGDEIPLTLVIETAKDVVLDLVNLPRQGEQHGHFEIRDFRLTKTARAPHTTVYRVAYTLQYFGVAPLMTQFEPLEILYALAAEMSPDTPSVSPYKRLYTQPVAIHIARIGPFRSTPARDAKGPLDDRRSTLIWLPGLFGTALLGVAVVGWRRERQRARSQQIPAVPSAPLACQCALQSLRDMTALSVSWEAPSALAIGARMSQIVREFLQREYSIAAFSLTSTELARRLHDDAPHLENLLDLLQRCDAIQYQPPAPDGAAARHLWEEACSLFEHLDCGVHHD